MLGSLTHLSILYHGTCPLLTSVPGAAKSHSPFCRGSSQRERIQLGHVSLHLQAYLHLL